MGVPRMIVRYTLLTAFRNEKYPYLLWLERMTATRKPMTRPSRMAKSATSSVTPRPRSRYSPLREPSPAGLRKQR